MTEQEQQLLYEQINGLLDIYNQNPVILENGTFVPDAIKPKLIEMINFIVSDDGDRAALLDWLDKTDFWIAPASTRFHGNFKYGLSLHTLKVIHMSLVFTQSIFDNFIKSPQNQFYSVTAQDIFIAALSHDFCKTNFYAIEYRNTKDITGNWVKTPCYKTKNDNRNLGHGNESVLMLLQIMPSYINKRYVLEAVSRHMGFSDLSDNEMYNYSNFLQNPLVVLLQLADQTAAQWFNC